MGEEACTDIEKLELDGTIGYNGKVPNGLKVHPDCKNLIYPLGNTVIIEDVVSHKQSFLSGHTDDVSCIAVSKSGNYLASGQVTHMGFKANIIIWCYATRSMHAMLALHKVKVESLSFSVNDEYLVSLGGRDDGSVVVWNVKKKEAICGSPAAVLSAGVSHCVTCANTSDDMFVTGGDRTLRVWKLDLRNRKTNCADVQMGQLKRVVKCIVMDQNDKYFYCGTTSGDILQVNTERQILARYGPVKDMFSLGVTSLALLKTDDILVGTGSGTVAVVRGEKFKKVKSSTVKGGVLSIGLRGHGHQFFVGTDSAEVHRFDFSEFTSELVKTCHDFPVNDVAFPFGSSELFATCANNDIRVWETKSGKELRRIVIPNMKCHAVDLMMNGTTIVSAWDDGKIRAFMPLSGKLKFTINDAHNKGVTALATTSDCLRIVSGGGEGQVRVWDITTNTTSLKEAMKEHKGAVTCIKLRKNDKECVSASLDGTCIIWDLVRFVRNQVIFANTLFKCVSYNPEESQIITSGSDRKIGYWETYDGSQIRELDGSKSGSVNALDISMDGSSFATGGDDKIIKVWKYNEGEVTHVGIGHSGNINRLKISPNLDKIVSVSQDGAILIWKYPYQS
ncbi:cilia- and flagella-associated protein 52-like [Ptychodera flava]|uniref:cilia- and flagella-associated protein 52-like n=1 Tax=Ptychodera flava TaxID=63121 RepID=UPI00396A8F8C